MTARKRPRSLGCRRLRDVVTIQSESSTQDAAGQPIKTPSAVSSYRAEIELISGNEPKRGDQVTAILTHKVTMRNSLSVTQGMRVLVVSSEVANTNDVLNIEGIERRAESRNWMTLLCRQEGV